MIPVSVVVCTSPGRESQLDRCLKQLAQQDQLFFDVTVVDDGSTDGAEVCRRAPLAVQYDWRPNDGSPARSRNRGAALSRSELLVFLDSDVLLNSAGLSAYASWLTGQPQRLLYGYVGTDLTHVSPSCLQPPTPVHALDKRFTYSQSRLQPHPWLFHSPQENAFAGNLGLHRRSLERLGGFDERFQGWGGEDLDLGERALRAGLELHFLLDAWAEHQEHARSDDFHLRPAEARGRGYVFKPHGLPGYTVQCFSSPEGQQSLHQRLAAAFP
ncbi:MAG: glycosyltransferase family 2 protein [Candidatus Sericytochromatia bacterium]